MVTPGRTAADEIEKQGDGLRDQAERSNQTLDTKVSNQNTRYSVNNHIQIGDKK